MSDKNPIEMTIDELVAAFTPYDDQRRLVILVGVAASGKSTIGDGLARAGFRRLSFDLVRAELFGEEAVQGSGKRVGRRFRELLAKALSDGVNIVVDNTNFMSDMRWQVIDQGREAGVTDIHIVVMDTPLAECFRRNRLRQRQLPETSILFHHQELYGKYWPRKKEGAITIVRPTTSPGRVSVSGFAAHNHKHSRKEG